MKRLLWLIPLLLTTSAFAAVSRTGFCAAAANNCNLNAVNTGDLVVTVAYRNASGTAPALPASNTNVTTKAQGTAGVIRVYCRMASSSGDTGTGTSTNATEIFSVAYSGTSVKSTASCPTTGIGAFTTSSAAASTSVSYGVLAMLDKTGSSWVMGVDAQTVATPCTPTGMSSVGSAGTGPAIIGNDTNAGVSSWPTTTCTISSGTWITAVIEILAPQTYGTPSMVSWGTGPMADNGAIVVGPYNGELVDTGALSGNTVVACGNTNPGQGTITPSDNIGTNTWYVTIPTANGGQTAFCVFAQNVAALTRQINILFGSATDFTQLQLFQLTNVAPGAALDVATVNTGTSTTPTCAAMTTLFNGDILLQYAESEGNATASWAVGSAGSLSWKLAGAQLGKGQSAQWAVQPSAGAITPSMTQGTSTTWGTVCMAFKGGVSGSVPTGEYVTAVQHETYKGGGSTTINFQFPVVGNTHLLMWSGASGDHITSLTTSGKTWTQIGTFFDPVSDSVEQMWIMVNDTTPSNSMAITAVQNTAVGDDTYVWYDIVGAAASPVDNSATGGAGCTSCTGRITATQNRADALAFTTLTLTPSTPNGMMFCSAGIQHNTVNGTNGTVMLLDAWYFVGENGFASPYDENNLWSWYRYSSTSAIPCALSFQSGTDVVGQVVSQAVAIMAPSSSAFRHRAMVISQ